MKTIEINKTWHKANDSVAITYKQINYINELINDKNIEGWGGSTTNIMRSLTKYDGSEIIDALKHGHKVIID